MLAIEALQWRLLCFLTPKGNSKRDQMMLALCKGGPYDGTGLDHNDINLYCESFLVGMRKFIILPAFRNWDAFRRGEIDKSKAFDVTSPVYELIRTPNAMEAVFDSQGELFKRAQRDEAEGRGPRPVELPFTGAFYQCFQGEWLLGLPSWFKVVDEKGRAWACRQIGHDGWNAFEPDDYSQIQARHKELGIEEGLKEVSLHSESLALLSARLSDYID